MSKNKMNSIAVLCLASVPTLALAGRSEAQTTAAAKPTTPHMTTTSASSGTAGELKGAMRKLWEEHIVYTRNYIISALAGLPDTDAVAQRLLRNQDDIGNAIKPYYGDAGGAKLSTLLRDHITIATEVVKAAKGGDKAQLATAQQKWSANGKDIAGFLSGANPNWTRKALEDMLQIHLDLTTGEVVGRLNKDWAADIKAYDDGHAHMLMFADALTDGIVKQFPAKFKK
jgi:phage terminase Nu1 subunit (DNA packaging protein)